MISCNVEANSYSTSSLEFGPCILCLFNSINQVEANEYPVVYFYDARQDSPYTEQLMMKMHLTKFSLAVKKKLHENFPDKSAT